MVRWIGLQSGLRATFDSKVAVANSWDSLFIKTNMIIGAFVPIIGAFVPPVTDKVNRSIVRA